MENPYSGGGNWTMIPNVSTPCNVSTPSNQDHVHLQQQFQQQQIYQQQQRLLLQSQPQAQPQQHHQSLASHFHLFPLVEKLADTIENGNRDTQSDALITDLNNHFEKCQQLLNSISGSISTKAMTVEGQKRKLVESEQMLNQRRDLIGKYRMSVEELVRSEP
ncbi:hypothetical protein UlMin_011927 [Ulmus minor]